MWGWYHAALKVHAAGTQAAAEVGMVYLYLAT
jgi:hypothetical protein